MSDRHYIDMREIWESLPEGTDAQTACEAFAKVSADAERPLVEAIRNQHKDAEALYEELTKAAQARDRDERQAMGEAADAFFSQIARKHRDLLATYENGGEDE